MCRTFATFGKDESSTFKKKKKKPTNVGKFLSPRYNSYLIDILLLWLFFQFSFGNIAFFLYPVYYTVYIKHMVSRLIDSLIMLLNDKREECKKTSEFSYILFNILYIIYDVFFCTEYDAKHNVYWDFLFPTVVS